ncbi:MAG: site-specific DNA-methyltransferase [Candidatus Portiera sp.]|nr:site-specific DNA-methyltransferase [Portiera sp.]
MDANQLYYGDCLDWMVQAKDESVDLIYLDPPFNSKANYNITYGDSNGKPAQVVAFEDTWFWDSKAKKRVDRFKNAIGLQGHKSISGLYSILGDSGMIAYLSYMAERLAEMNRLLKNSGSIFLHCDPTASHYLKILMDDIFGHGCFRNEIIWYYKNASRGKRELAHSHDVLLWYSKSGEKESWTFNYKDILVPYESGMTEWRYTKGGQKGKTLPKGKVPDDVIALPSLNAMAKERLGYPTQKPESLLEHIIITSSKENDVVLDPFCGCGTAMAVAKKLNRRWIGIDISPMAIDLVKYRKLKDKDIPVNGIPTDIKGAQQLAVEKPFDFEKWVLTRLDGFMPNRKQTGDGGLDGRAKIAHPKADESGLAIAEVKGGANVGVAQIRAFAEVIQREGAQLGVFITLRKLNASGAIRQVLANMNSEPVTIESKGYSRLQLYSIEEYFDSRKPNLPPMLDPYTSQEIHPELL